MVMCVDVSDTAVIPIVLCWLVVEGEAVVAVVAIVVVVFECLIVC